MTGACRPSIVKREKDTQFARLVMAHIDSDTIPFFWQCASLFVLFDEIFAAKDKAWSIGWSIAGCGVVCSALTCAGVLYPCRATSQVSL